MDTGTSRRQAEIPEVVPEATVTGDVESAPTLQAPSTGEAAAPSGAHPSSARALPADAHLSLTAFLAAKGLGERGVDLPGPEKTRLMPAVTVETPPVGDASGVPGIHIGARHTVARHIAAGGMGRILLARDVNIRRPVAMKVMNDRGRLRAVDIARFVEEAQITGQLEHPNIVPVHDLGLDDDGRVYYTMKFIEGVTLALILKRLRSGDPETVAAYPLARLLTIFLKACDAVAFAHSRGVVHRDLKPDNLMVGDFGEVLVVDWGLAKVVGRDDEAEGPSPDDSGNADEAAAVAERVDALAAMAHKMPPATAPSSGRATAPRSASATTPRAAAGPAASSAAASASSTASRRNPFIDSVRQAAEQENRAWLTMDGMVMGTPTFMAPEQARGRISEIDARTDIYALGAILYNILTLNPPIEGQAVDDVLKKVLRGSIRHPLEYNPVVLGFRRRNSRDRAGTTTAPSTTVMPPGGTEIVSRAPRPTPATTRLETADASPETTAAGPGLVVPLAHCPGGLVPDGLAAVAMKALAFQPVDRYQNVSDLHREIEAFQSGYATIAEDAGRWRQIMLLLRRHQTLATVIVGGIAVIGTILTTSFVGINRERVKAQAAIERVRTMAPALVAQARQQIRDGRLDSARRTLDGALELRPNTMDYLVLRGHVLQSMMRFDEAAAAYQKALDLDPDHRIALDARAVSLDLASRHLDPDTADFNDLRPLFSLMLEQRRQDELQLLLPRVAEQRELALAAAQQILEAHRIEATVTRTASGDLSLTVVKSPVFTLDLVKGLPFEEISLTSCPKVTSLEALRHMPVRSLSLTMCPVRDLEPLRGLPLKTLVLERLPITDLAPLADCRQLGRFEINAVDLVSDYRPLAGLPITQLAIGASLPQDHSFLTTLPLTQVIMLRDVPDLDWARGKLLQSFRASGTFTDLSPIAVPTLRNVYLDQAPECVDLAPLQLCTGLREVTVHPHAGPAVSHLADLTSLTLVGFDYETRKAASEFWKEYSIHAALYDANPGYPFNGKFSLDPDGRLIAALFEDSQLIHLQPLRNQPCQILAFVRNPNLVDLSPLAGMSLEKLILHDTGVFSLEPLETNAVLNELHLINTPVRSLAPVSKMPIKTLVVDNFKAFSEAARNIPTLETINDKPAADVLSGKVDARLRPESIDRYNRPDWQNRPERPRLRNALRENRDRTAAPAIDDATQTPTPKPATNEPPPKP